MKVDLEAVVLAFSDDSVERSYYLDRDSGRIFNVLEDHDDPETRELVWQLEADSRNRYVQIPKPSMEETLKEQDVFVDSIVEEELKTNLTQLLEDDHDGSKFIDFIERNKSARNTWRQFRKVRSRKQATDWLTMLRLPTTT